MKKIFLTSILLIQIINFSNSQEITGRASYYVDLGEDRHVFVGTTLFNANSYLFTYKSHEKNIWTIDTNYVIQRVFTDTIGHQVFKPQMSEKDLVVRDFCTVGKPNYYKDSPDFDWQIQNDMKVIAGLSCQLAKTSFRGRSYEVWFSKEIPTAAGPWKFSGLPGLIIKISDATGEVNIQLKKFEYTDQPYKSPTLKSGKLVKMGDFYNCMDKEWEKRTKRIRAIIAQSRAESPDLTITVTEAKRRPATELDY